MSAPKTAIWSAPLIAALASIAACDIAFGLTFQLQPLIMEKAGFPAWQIGTVVAMGPLGILMAGPFLPRIIGRMGSKSVAMAAIIALFFVLLSFKLVQPGWAWAPLRLLFGVATGTLFTVSETWVLTMSSEETRGRVMGLYSSVLAMTFGIGPVIIPFTGIGGWAPWLICMAFVALGLIPLFFLKHDTSGHGEEKGSIIDVVRRQPLIFGCAITATLFDSILISFFTIYAIRAGVALEQASTLLGVAIIGGVFLFYPMGILADRWSRDGVVNGCAIVTMVFGLLITPLINTVLIWPLMLIFCATGFGVYVIALATIGTAFKGKDVIAASAAIAATWGIGGVIGPPLAGRLIDYFGASIVPFVLIGIYAILTLLLAANGMRVLRPVTP